MLFLENAGTCKLYQELYYILASYFSDNNYYMINKHIGNEKGERNCV